MKRTPAKECRYCNGTDLVYIRIWLWYEVPLLLTMAHGIAVVALDASSLMCTLESYPPMDYQ